MNSDNVPLLGGAPIDSGRKFTTHIVSIALGVLLFFSALLNVAQYQHGQSPMARAALGDGRYAMHAVFTLEKPSKHGKCADELVLRHVEQGREEEEDAEGDGHDVSRE